MIITNVASQYNTSMPSFGQNAYEDPHTPQPPAPAPEAAEIGAAVEYQRTSKVIITPDGETVMQYTTLTPSGAIMRKNVTLSPATHGVADDGTMGNAGSSGMGVMGKRSEAYEGMMLYG